MITREEFLQNSYTISHFFDDKTKRMVCFSDDVQKAMKEYTEEAIKADRINLLNHVICYETNELNFNSAEDENGNLSNLWSIDRESLLSAPNIELL